MTRKLTDLIEDEQNQKKQIKMNMNAMSIELDKLGHQKNTEQMTRLKLEEEYAQNAKSQRKEFVGLSDPPKAPTWIF